VRYYPRSISSKTIHKNICSTIASNFPCETTGNTKGARDISDTLDAQAMTTMMATIVRRCIVHTILVEGHFISTSKPLMALTQALMTSLEH
jgi:hypothetical protein